MIARLDFILPQVSRKLRVLILPVERVKEK
jgi:hypothetical protein